MRRHFVMCAAAMQLLNSEVTFARKPEPRVPSPEGPESGAPTSDDFKKCLIYSCILQDIFYRRLFREVEATAESGSVRV
jgi:hypothetical protein